MVTLFGLTNNQALYSSETDRSEEHTSELQSHHDLVCRLLLEKKKNTSTQDRTILTAIRR